ncbi:unnamed protein product [Closterium sp. Naga37s-1]|nr:unnamed protein product [Closterium sp. Naga37s-1]
MAAVKWSPICLLLLLLQVSSVLAASSASRFVLHARSQPRSLNTPWTAIRTAALADAKMVLDAKTDTKTVLVGWRYTRWHPRVKSWPAPRIHEGDTVG